MIRRRLMAAASDCSLDGYFAVEAERRLLSRLIPRCDLGYPPGAEKPAAHRQPLRSEVVAHVLGTLRHPCLRAGQYRTGDPGRMKTVNTYVLAVPI